MLGDTRSPAQPGPGALCRVTSSGTLRAMTPNGRAVPRPRSSKNQTTGEPTLLLVAEDQRLRDDIALIAAVVGARLEVFHRWAHVDASVEQDAVAVLCSASAVPRTAVRAEKCLLVGHDAASVWQAAAEAPGLRPVPLPAGEKWLTEHLSTKVLDRSQGRVIAVAGSTGGAGATTFAYLCAAELAARGLSPLLLDAAGGPGSGVADLVRTARREGRVQGGALDWQELASVEGELSATQLKDAVPQWEGIGLLSGSAAGARADSRLRAAVVAGRRAYDVVVIDAGQQIEALVSLGEQVDELLIVVRASRRGVDAARGMISAVPQTQQWIAVNGPTASGWSVADVHAELQTPVIADLPVQKWLARSDELAEAYELLRSRRGAALVDGVLGKVGAFDA